MSTCMQIIFLDGIIDHNHLKCLFVPNYMKCTFYFIHFTKCSYTESAQSLGRYRIWRFGKVGERYVCVEWIIFLEPFLHAKTFTCTINRGKKKKKKKKRERERERERKKRGISEQLLVGLTN